MAIKKNMLIMIRLILLMNKKMLKSLNFITKKKVY